jgi:hypothetical protein
MTSERKVRKLIRQWRKRYPFPVDWVDDRANRMCRRSESEWLAQFDGASNLRRREVLALARWRLADQPDRSADALSAITGPAEWGHARRCIKRALATANPVGALDCLLGESGGVPGWGPEMASAILAACRPDAYPVADRRALQTLRVLDLHSPVGSDAFSRADWWPYVRLCRQLAMIGGVSLREVRQALWAAGDEAPKLPRASKASKAPKASRPSRAA